MKIRIVSCLALFALISCVLVSCWKDVTPSTKNPYDDVDYVTPPAPVDTLDPSSFVALHRNIFQPRCANPGCHDGNFEPDFRTLESSYATLVYHPIIKNNNDSTFAFRVIPFDKAKSVLYERLTNCCFVNQNDRMPQDNIGVPLEADKISAIETWITNGARDMFGNLPHYPNSEPTIAYYVAVNSQFQPLSETNSRIDSVYYNPFIVAKNFAMSLIIEVTDDSTSVPNLLYNKFKMSYEPDNFTASAPGFKEYQAFVFTLPGNGKQYLMASVNTGDFSPDKVVYFRFYTNDGDHSFNTEFPYSDLPLPYKTFFSFYILP